MSPSPLQRRMGTDWQRLPAVLRAHHRGGSVVERGRLDVTHPAHARPLLWLLRRLGALVRRQGCGLPTLVTREQIGGRQRWRRTIAWPDGRRERFDSEWLLVDGAHLIEFVDPVLGWELMPEVVDGRLCVHGARYVARLGGRLWTIPRWLTPGEATIVEAALDADRYTMDFRLVHPLLGEVFRYRGTFIADRSAADD